MRRSDRARGGEQLLGFTKVGNTLRLNPCVPVEWPSYDISYRFGSSRYDITVLAPADVQQRGMRVTVDGRPIPSGLIALVDDGAIHRVIVNAPVVLS
jgi:cellobiose phosphorylase